MRYRLTLLVLVVVLPMILFAMLPLRHLLAAPLPTPSGILDIGPPPILSSGPPPKSKTAEQHLKDQIGFQTDHWSLDLVSSDPEVRKLSWVATMRDARPWLAQNLRVTPVDGVRRLRFDFRAGTRNEQVTIINAFLRAAIFRHDRYGGTLKCTEQGLKIGEESILDLEDRIKSGQHPHMVQTYREGINYLRNTKIPELRAALADWKQYAVIKWAR